MLLPGTDDDYYIVGIYFPLLKVKAERLPVFNYPKDAIANVTIVPHPCLGGALIYFSSLLSDFCTCVIPSKL